MPAGGAESNPNVVRVHALPRRIDELNPAVTTYWNRFSPERVERNLQIANGLLREARQALHNPHLYLKDEQRSLLLNFTFEVMNQTLRHHHYVPYIPGFKDAPDAMQSLKENVPSFEQSVPDIDGSTELTAYAQHVLSETTSNLIFVSDSHSSLFEQLEAIHDVGIQNVGVIVFDRHADINSNELTQEQARQDPRYHGKANVLHAALEHNYLKAVSIIGVPHTMRSKIINGDYDEHDKFKPTHEVYNAYSNQISMANETAYSERKAEEQFFDMKKFREEVAKQVRFLQQAGVQHIVLSFDVDCLQTGKNGYTVMEYSPFSSELFFSFLDLEKLNQKFGDSSEHISVLLEKAAALYSTLTNPTSTKELFVDGLSPREKVDIASLPSRSSTFYGLPFELILQAVDEVKEQCNQQGINFGVKLPTGGKYLGDVTEISAPDAGNRVAEVVTAYTRRLAGQTRA